MPNSKSYKQLSNILSEVLTSTLKKADASNALKALEERKEDLSSLFEAPTKATKAKKDPNAPKRNKTAYIIFCSEKRSDFKKKFPDSTSAEITSKIAEAWNNISEKDKKKFGDLAEKDKVRYNEEKSNYTPSSDYEEEEKPKRKAKKERTGPKRPLSSYLFFCQDARDEVKRNNPEMNGTLITTELGRLWRELTEEQKKPYMAQQAKDKERYLEEKGESGEPAKPSKKAPTKAPEPKGKAKVAPSKAEPAKKAVAKAVPSKTDAKKPTPAPKAVAKAGAGKAEPKGKPAPPTKGKSPGFSVFVEETRDDVESENPNWPEKKVMADLEKRWKDLSTDDREAYEMEAQAGSDSEAEELLEEDD